MVRYFTHRLTEAAIVLLLMSFCIYGLLGLMPGDPIDLMLSGDPNITSQDIARLKAVYGLDRPLLERYATGWPTRCAASSAIPGCTPGRRSRSCCPRSATPAC